MNDSLDTLLQELTSFSLPCKNDSVHSLPPVNQKTELNEDKINDYILNKTSNLIDAGIGAVEDLKDYIVQGQNPDEIAALSELISSTTKAIEALNRINLLNKKTKADKELKIIDIEAKKEIAGKIQNNITHNTNVLVTSRKEIFKHLLSGDSSSDNSILEITDTTVIDEIDNK